MQSRTFSTHLLDAAARDRSERLERERQAVLERVSRTLRSEASRLGIVEAYVVGSLATERGWVDGSDVDIAIAGGDPLEVMTVVEEAADRSVDVIDLERHPEPGMFRRRGIQVVG